MNAPKHIATSLVIAAAAVCCAAGRPVVDDPTPTDGAARAPVATESTPYDQQAVIPADMQALGRLVGRWRLSGDVDGEIAFEPLEGGMFLMQRADFDHGPRHVKGFEIIGHLRPWGGEVSPDIHSRWYDDQGNTFDYVYELQGDTLTIWGGQKGSPARYIGRFSADGDTLNGAWVYPGGGGYTANATRIK